MLFPLFSAQAVITDEALGDRETVRQQVEERAEQAARGAAASSTPAARFTPVVPELSVPIPGVTFTPPVDEGDDIVVPYAAQYISGIYRYLLGISTLVAIIVVITGGFLYLLGQTRGDADKGLTLIKDAIGGLVVLYASYLILWTVNPELVNLQPIRLARIQSVIFGENSGADGDFSQLPSGEGEPVSGGSSQCRLRYNQGQSPWNSIPYGNVPALIANATDQRPTCATSRDSNGSACIGTFQMSGCGPSAVASVLAFYGLQISVSQRVPAPGTAMHLVDPIDTGIFASVTRRSGQNHHPGQEYIRIVGVGTDGDIMTRISQGFPQFQARTISKANNGAAILASLRAGRPLVFGCSAVHLFSDDAATQPIANREGNTVRYNDGHFMVLSGVVNDEILRVWDVGNTRTKTMRLDEYVRRCGSPVEITPRTGAPETATATWGTGAQAFTVQMRLPPQNGTQCRATEGAAPGARAQTTGDIDSYPFTYRPTGQPASVWPDASARLLFPNRLRSLTSPPRVRVFIYLHGNNSGDQPPESRYIPYLRNALQRVAGSKDIVVMTPHHNNAGNDYPGFNLNDFYQTGLRALQAVIPGATVQDVVVGGHSGATCNGGPVILQALNSPLPGTRGVIAYDGCLGDVLTPTNASGGSGISLYLNPDTAGMGNDDPSSVSGNERRNAIVRRLWSLGSQTCPACAASAGAQCYGQSAAFSRPGGGELISFETSAGHGPSVEKMTDIAFCAFYR